MSWVLNAGLASLPGQSSFFPSTCQPSLRLTAGELGTAKAVSVHLPATLVGAGEPWGEKRSLTFLETPQLEGGVSPGQWEGPSSGPRDTGSQVP